MFFVLSDALNPHGRECENSGALGDNMLEVVGLYLTFCGVVFDWANPICFTFPSWGGCGCAGQAGGCCRAVLGANSTGEFGR